MTKLKNHPLAEIFPSMGESEKTHLVNDIAKHGLRSSIITFEGKILDGRHRYEACLSAGVEPKFKECKGDPLALVLSANLKRRHLTESQRAMIGAHIAKLETGQHTSSFNKRSLEEEMDEMPPLSTSQAADALNVSVSSVEKAKAVLKKSPRKAKQVASGEKSLNAAANELKEKEKAKEEVKDPFNRKVPEPIVTDYLRSIETAKEFVGYIQKICNAFRDGVKNNDTIYREFTNSILSQIEGLRYTIKSQLPAYAVCPDCHGSKPEKCEGCSSRGFISKYLWDSPGNKKQKVLIETKAKQNE